MTDNTAFALIETSTGRILSSGVCEVGAADHLVNDPATQQIIETAEAYQYNAHWYDGSNFVEKTDAPGTWDKTSIDANGVDTATLSGLPIPCGVEFEGNTYNVTDGSFEFTAVAPGDYYVELDEPAYFNKGWKIDAS